MNRQIVLMSEAPDTVLFIYASILATTPCVHNMRLKGVYPALMNFATKLFMIWLSFLVPAACEVHPRQLIQLLYSAANILL